MYGFAPTRSCDESLLQLLVFCSRDRKGLDDQRNRSGLCYLVFGFVFSSGEPRQSRFCFVSVPAAALQEYLTCSYSVEVFETVVRNALVFHSPVVGRKDGSGSESGTQQAATHGASSGEWARPNALHASCFSRRVPIIAEVITLATLW